MARSPILTDEITSDLRSGANTTAALLVQTRESSIPVGGWQEICAQDARVSS